MTISHSGVRNDARLIAHLRKQLAVADTEVNLHLAEVRRYQFIVSEITEAAEGGIFVQQAIESDYLYISEQLATILGYGDVGMPPSYAQFMEQVHPDDLAASARRDRFFPVAPGTHLEFRYRNQAGLYRWYRASAKEYRPEDGPKQIIGLIIDIHATKELEEQRRQVNEELKAFMYSVAHDLRAPVRHIASFAEMLREEEEAAYEEREVYLDYVEQSAARLGKMIDGLLMLSRNQRYVPKYAPVDVEQMLDKLIRGTRQTERQAEELVIESDAFPVIYSDPMLVEQVLQNLLSNAIKYSSNRDRAVVRINYYLQESQHIISFSDNGIGFDPAYADKLFKLFSRLYAAKDIPGTGVGLASVHRIMRSLGGSIEADGKLGVGATFTLRFPVRVGATSAF